MIYVSKSHAVKLTEEKSTNATPITNYVPHHGVVNINKPRKVRVVFDAAAEFQKNSLNKNLLKGSDYPSRDKFAVMTDIEQMYHHVK